MTRLLLDTNVVLRLATEPELLADDVVTMLQHPDTTLTISTVTAWEIAIKWRIGRLPLPEQPGPWVTTAVRAFGAEVLPVALHHALAVADLPDHHRDPFDRLLIAQARTERLPIVTSDRAFAAYDIEVVPAR